MVSFSCLRARVVASLPAALAALSSASAGCGTRVPAGLFGDAGSDAASSPGGAVDAGPLLLEMDKGSQSIDFGAAPCGGAAPAPMKIVLKNVGRVPIVYRAALDSQASFVITGGQNAVVPQGGTATITLLAQPIAGSATAGMAVRATLTLVDSYGHVPWSVPVTVTPHGGTLSVAPASVAFGEVPLTTEASGAPLAIANTGNKAITVMVMPASDADFSVTWTGGPGPTEVAPGQVLAGAVARFRPSSTGAHEGDLVVVAAGTICGVAAAPRIALSGSASGPAVDAGPGSDAGAIDASPD